MPQISYTKTHVKVADELFLITALLQRENPRKQSFSLQELLDRAKKEGLGEARSDQKSLRQHAYEHGAANIPPSTGRYRMIFREENNEVRLLRKSDFIHPERNGKLWPRFEDIPEKYHDLIKWAQDRYTNGGDDPPRWLNGLFKLRGLGKEVWKGVDPDQYVREMREGWE